jgi:hypothetical protein
VANREQQTPEFTVLAVCSGVFVHPVPTAFHPRGCTWPDAVLSEPFLLRSNRLPSYQASGPANTSATPAFLRAYACRRSPSMSSGAGPPAIMLGTCRKLLRSIDSPHRDPPGTCLKLPSPPRGTFNLSSLIAQSPQAGGTAVIGAKSTLKVDATLPLRPRAPRVYLKRVVSGGASPPVAPEDRNA